MSIIVILSLVNGMNEQTMKWMTERGGLAKITILIIGSQRIRSTCLIILAIRKDDKSLVPEAEVFNANIIYVLILNMVRIRLKRLAHFRL